MTTRIYQTTLWTKPVAVIAVYPFERVEAVKQSLSLADTHQVYNILYAQDNEAQDRFEYARAFWKSAGGQEGELSSIWTAGIGDTWKEFGEASPSCQYVILCLHVTSGLCPHGESIFDTPIACEVCSKLGEKAWWVKR